MLIEFQAPIKLKAGDTLYLRWDSSKKSYQPYAYELGVQDNKFEEMFKFNGDDLDEFFVLAEDNASAKPKEKIKCDCSIDQLLYGGCLKPQEHD